jgi:hypothetical protein
VFKRTQKYTVAEFELLERLLAIFKKIVTTPQVIAEVSNLATLHGGELIAFRQILSGLIDVLSEDDVSSRAAASDLIFHRLGITDAAIVVSAHRGPLVLTDDLDLYLALAHRGLDVLNFNHMRGWNLLDQ